MIYGGSQTNHNLTLTFSTCAATASTNETNSEQMTINSPVYQVIDNKNQIHQSDPRSGIDYSHTAISAYRTTDTSTDPEIVSEHDEDYERNEMTGSREVGTDMGFLTTLVNEFEDSEIMRQENQSSLHFTLTANSAYGTDVATAPEILTEQNEAYERNEVTTSRDTNGTEFTTSMSEIEDPDIVQRENQPSLHFTLTANSAYGTDVAIAPEILTEENEAYERNEVSTSRDTNGTEFTTLMSEIEHLEIMRREYQPITCFTVKVSNPS